MHYRIAFDLEAKSQVEALHQLKEHFEGLYITPLTLSIKNLDRRRMLVDCLGWGAVVGIVFATYALYCISEGWWTR